MSSETAELLAPDNRFPGGERTLKIGRFSSSQLENLLHVQAMLLAYFYRFDGETTQCIDVYTPSLLSTSRRTSRVPVKMPVNGSMRLVEIKAELNELFGNYASGISSIKNAKDEQSTSSEAWRKTLVFFDADYPIEDWLRKNTLTDITVFCALNAEGMRISFRSRFESVDEDSLDSIFQHFSTFSESIELGGDQIRVKDIGLLTAEDVEIHGMVSPASEDSFNFKLPHRLFESLSEKFPARTALKLGSQSITYEELNNRANKFAHHLQNSDVHRGARCVVLLKPSFDTIVVMLAIFKVGAVYIPVDFEYPAERVNFVIEDSDPVAIVGSDETIGLVDSAACKINVDTLGNDFAAYPSSNLETFSLEGDEAYVFYTSGTTGKPKGVVGSYGNLFHYVTVAKSKFGMGPDTIMPIVAKSSFSISFFETLTPLISGGSGVLLPRSDVLDVNRMIEVLRDVTMFHIGPSLLSRIIRKLRQDEPLAAFPNIVHASTGGDMVPVELLHEMSKVFASAEVYVIYGSSEIACMGCTYLLNRWDLPSKTLVGKAFPGMQVDIVDADMNVLPPGWKGEICFLGNGVTRGYQNNSELTHEKYYQQGARRGYRTGDVGRIDRSGNIEMLGRSDFQVKINGVRVELVEIDYYLKKSPHVTDIISRAFQTEDGSTVVYACVVGDLTRKQIADIRTYLAINLPEYMHPKGFIRIEKMPLNPNLKVDRKALPGPTADNLIRESDYVAPETTTEKRLANIWEKILNITPIGVDDDFFASGGTSLQGIDLLVTIEEQLGSTIGVNEFMQARTIRQLAQYVDGCKSPADDVGSVITFKSGSADKTLFFIHDGEGDIFPYLSLSQFLDSDWSVYGIVPRALGYAKIAHTSFEAMVDFYVSEIHRTKPQGPYLLGGLCIGGFLAYCVGCKLQELGDQVAHIILFDSHHIDATPIKGREQAERSGRLKLAFADAKPNSSLKRAFDVIKVVAKKGRGYLMYQFVQRVSGTKKKVQIFLLRNSPPNGGLMKSMAPDVDTVIRYAEHNFRLRPRFKGRVTLFRATRKLQVLDSLNIDDTPYREVFAEADLGWSGSFDGDLSIQDVAAGHSTLLTPPYVGEIAREINRIGSLA